MSRPKVVSATVVDSRGYILFVEDRPVVFCATRGLAERIGGLLDEHGLVDVPDTIEGVDA